ncbi:hypothetical protein IL54_3853 [Sphingobium sp. ba1]|nr:hypothetical protein IL54_3853 [Sphingobium sp. ba1]
MMCLPSDHENAMPLHRQPYDWPTNFQYAQGVAPVPIRRRLAATGALPTGPRPV